VRSACSREPRPHDNPFGKLKARLLTNPKIKAEYQTLAPEFEIAAEPLRAACIGEAAWES